MEIGRIAWTYLNRGKMNSKFSLRSRNTANRIIERAASILRIPANAGKLQVLVEGNFDRCYYDIMFDASKIILVPTDGIDNMDEIIKNYVRNKIKYVAIKDSDFKDFVPYVPLPNVYYTDAHDAEMSFFKFQVAAQKFAVFLSGKSQIINYNNAFSDLEDYSYYKMGNIKYNCQIDFSSMNEKVKTATKLDYVYITTQVSRMKNVKSLQQGVFNNLKFSYPYEIYFFNLLNGHDFLNRLCHQINQNGVDEKYLDKILLSLLNIDMFKSMKLYSDLEQWEKGHFPILRR